LVAMTHAACIGLLVPASERRLTPPKR
jgi:hypothetical protein